MNSKDAFMLQKEKKNLAKATIDIVKSSLDQKENSAAFLGKGLQVEAVKKIVEEVLKVLQDAKKHKVSTLQAIKKVKIEEP